MQLASDALARLKGAREACGLHQTQAARAVGKSRISVARWESGERCPKEEDLRRLCELYGTTYEWIVDGIGQEPEPSLERLRLAKVNFEKMTGESSIRYEEQLPYGSRLLDDRIQKSQLDQMQSVRELLKEISLRFTGVLYRGELPKMDDLHSQVIKAIASGKVIPVDGILSRLGSILGVDEAWLLLGKLPHGFRHENEHEPGHIGKEVS